MKEFRAKQGFSFYSYPLYEEEWKKIDGIEDLPDRSAASELESRHTKKGVAYDPFRLFEMILRDFSLETSCLREIESVCQN